MTSKKSVKIFSEDIHILFKFLLISTTTISITPLDEHVTQKVIR